VSNSGSDRAIDVQDARRRRRERSHIKSGATNASSGPVPQLIGLSPPTAMDNAVTGIREAFTVSPEVVYSPIVPV